ncbi:MAG: type II toxin-antitoxin system RelE/ParE family toxin [Patescibacteria group bacterium]
MNSSENWDLQIDLGVFKALRKISRRDAEALLAVIRLLPVNPYFGDIKKMKGEEHAWRRRIGAYRIFYRIKTAKKVLLVFRLERRTSKTY